MVLAVFFRGLNSRLDVLVGIFAIVVGIFLVGDGYIISPIVLIIGGPLLWLYTAPRIIRCTHPLSELSISHWSSLLAWSLSARVPAELN